MRLRRKVRLAPRVFRALTVNIPGAGFRHPAAEVVVLVEQEDVFIEAAEPEEKLPADEEAGPGKERRTHLALRQRELAVRVGQIGGQKRARLEEHPTARLHDLGSKKPRVGIAAGRIDEVVNSVWL